MIRFTYATGVDRRIFVNLSEDRLSLTIHARASFAEMEIKLSMKEAKIFVNAAARAIRIADPKYVPNK